MIHPAIVLAAILTLVGPAPQAASTGEFDLERTREVLTLQIEKILAQGTASVSIALVRDDAIVWSAAFGHSNVWARTKATPETLYCTGSTFKAVTATALLQLAEQGEFELDDPVNDYLPEDEQVKDRFDDPVTFDHVLAHTSGLTPGAVALPIWNRKLPQSIQEVITSMEAVRAPMEKYQYNNQCYALAGRLIEVISGQEYEEYVVEHVLEPLGVKTPAPVRPTPEMVERLALPYMPGPDGKPRPVPQTFFDVYPAGDVYLTAEEMARFLGAHLSGGVFQGARILGEEWVAEAHRPRLENYGLGWGVLERGGRRIIQHGGGVAGFLTMMVGDLDARVGCYVMSNASQQLRQLTAIALALLRGEEPDLASDAGD